MSEDIMKPVFITEGETELLVNALLELSNRYNRNAKNCLSGYGTVTSQAKYKDWLQRSESLFALAEKVSEPWI